jgi:putative transposase
MGTRAARYTSLEFTNRLHDWGFVGSYGSVGDCYDNSAIESCWATMKTEIRHIWGPFGERTRSEMRTILFDYIETFYNRTRHQQALGHHTPAEVYAAAITG